MPITEIEIHPYLNDQIRAFSDLKIISKYRRLIIGTFPIYAITQSIPLQGTKGEGIKLAWNNQAFMEFFYGSWENHFWEFFASAFDELIPGDKVTAIALLDKYNFILTDVFKSSYRKEYSPSDSDLKNMELNDEIAKLLYNENNINTIYFTSREAKKHFYKLLEMPYIKGDDIFQVIRNKNYRLIVLVSPAGNGRTVRHFYSSFPLNEQERNLIESNQTFSYEYRQRYYQHFLNQ